MGSYPFDRVSCWSLLVEARASSAKRSRVEELAKKWGCDNEDALKFAPFVNLRLFQDGDAFCAVHKDFTNLQECSAGFGGTYLDAIADLLRVCGYTPDKVNPTGIVALVESQFQRELAATTLTGIQSH